MITVNNEIDTFGIVGWDKKSKIVISSWDNQDDYIILSTDNSVVKVRGSDLITAIKNAQNSNRFNR